MVPKNRGFTPVSARATTQPKEERAQGWSDAPANEAVEAAGTAGAVGQWDLWEL
ncbi:MAG: hypothetical protein IJ228_04815 [Succinivibrio sp.]|nr:hypothetical protein [Succinivibrio sp.]